jgi:hypothetical protein
VKTTLHFLVGVPLAFGFVTIVTVAIIAVAIFCLVAPLVVGLWNDRSRIK